MDSLTRRPVAADPLFEEDLALARPAVCACGAAFTAQPGIASCPKCGKDSLFRRVTFLAELEVRLRAALADCTGQKDSLLAHLKSHEYQPPPTPPTRHRCVRCDGRLHLGYVQQELERFLCEPCAIQLGITSIGVIRSEFCWHMYPVTMCDHCRLAHSRRVRDAIRNPAPLLEREAAKTRAGIPSGATVEEM